MSNCQKRSVRATLCRRQATWTYVVLLRNIANEGNDFVASCTIQTAGRLIQEQDFWARDQLGRNTNASLLSAADTLADRCTYQSLGLTSQAKRFHQRFYPSNALSLADRTARVRRCVPKVGLHESGTLVAQVSPRSSRFLLRSTRQGGRHPAPQRTKSYGTFAAACSGRSRAAFCPLGHRKWLLDGLRH